MKGAEKGKDEIIVRMPLFIPNKED